MEKINLTPLVTVVMSTYNGNKKWIAESINSVFNQTYKNLELIIIDDCSTNNILETIKEYAQKNNKITYWRNSKNLGWAKSVNDGIKKSKGKYIARIDDDDIRSDETKIEKQVKFLEENPDYGLCGTEYTIVINEAGTKINKWQNNISDKDLRNRILWMDGFTHSSIIFKKESIEKVGFYNESFRAAADYELICRIGSIFKFCNIKGVSVSYRINTKGISITKHKLQYKNAIKVFRKNRNNFPNFYSALYHRIIDFLLPPKVIEILSKIKGRLKSKYTFKHKK